MKSSSSLFDRFDLWCVFRCTDAPRRVKVCAMGSSVGRGNGERGSAGKAMMAALLLLTTHATTARAADGAGPGLALVMAARLPGTGEKRFTFSPGIIWDHRSPWGFLTTWHAHVDFRAADGGQPLWLQVSLGAGASFPLSRRWGLW